MIRKKKSKTATMKTQTLSSYANFYYENPLKEVFMQKSRIHVSDVNFIKFECIVIGGNNYFVLKETTSFSRLQVELIYTMPATIISEYAFNHEQSNQRFPAQIQSKYCLHELNGVYGLVESASQLKVHVSYFNH